MNKIRLILVAVKDLNAKSWPAVLKAAQLARAFGAELELFHCLDETVYADVGKAGRIDRQRRTLESALVRLEAMAVRVRRHGVDVTVAAEWDYPVHEGVIRRAMKSGADMVVAGCDVRSHGLAWALRLNDWELVRHSPVPVLLVKSARLYRHPVVLAAVDPAHVHAKPARLDNELLSAARILGRTLHGKLHAVHGYWRIPLNGLAMMDIDPEILETIGQEADRQARLRFERAIKIARIPRARRHLLVDQPVEAITRAAAKSRAAIVVMGAISRSGIRNLLIGNTAERILDDLKCDILVLKPKGFKCRVVTSIRGARAAPMFDPFAAIHL